MTSIRHHHFHARYGNRKITVDIADATVKGDFPPRALGLVLEWWRLHREELATNWQLVTEGKEPKKIPPLE